MDVRADNLVIHPKTRKVAIIDFDLAKFPLENFGFFSLESWNVERNSSKEGLHLIAIVDFPS
jgi:aminoglycoside phosphotransferase (APT) family kinase protein